MSEAAIQLEMREDKHNVLHVVDSVGPTLPVDLKYKPQWEDLFRGQMALYQEPGKPWVLGVINEIFDNFFVLKIQGDKENSRIIHPYTFHGDDEINVRWISLDGQPFRSERKRLKLRPWKRRWTFRGDPV
ncbi:hypothetical protein D3C87_1670580 [compost metagenome]